MQFDGFPELFVTRIISNIPISERFPLWFFRQICEKVFELFCSCASYVCLFVYLFLFVCFFSMWDFFNEHSPITGLQGKEESISLTPLYHFHLLHRHLDIGRQDDYCRELTKFSSENHFCFVLSVLFSLRSSFL